MQKKVGKRNKRVQKITKPITKSKQQSQDQSGALGLRAKRRLLLFFLSLTGAVPLICLLIFIFGGLSTILPIWFIDSLTVLLLLVVFWTERKTILAQPLFMKAILVGVVLIMALGVVVFDVSVISTWATLIAIQYLMLKGTGLIDSPAALVWMLIGTFLGVCLTAFATTALQDILWQDPCVNTPKACDGPGCVQYVQCYVPEDTKNDSFQATLITMVVPTIIYIVLRVRVAKKNS